MKNILFLIVVMASYFTDYAQVFNAKLPSSTNNATRGINGQYLPIGYTSSSICTIVAGTVTPTTAPDTLKAPAVSYYGSQTDTGYVQFSLSARTSKLYDLSITALSGTLAGTAYLQGSRDNVVWYNITGNTTYCASCKGSSATLSGSGTTHYQWAEPLDGDIYQYHQIAVYMTGTCTAIFSGTQTVAY